MVCHILELGHTLFRNKKFSDFLKKIKVSLITVLTMMIGYGIQGLRDLILVLISMKEWEMNKLL